MRTALYMGSKTVLTLEPLCALDAVELPQARQVLCGLCVFVFRQVLGGAEILAYLVDVPGKIAQDKISSCHLMSGQGELRREELTLDVCGSWSWLTSAECPWCAVCNVQCDLRLYSM